MISLRRFSSLLPILRVSQLQPEQIYTKSVNTNQIRNSGAMSSIGNQRFCCTTTAKPGYKLNGKVAIVTASTQGIGYAVAERLGAEGAHVVVSSRKQENVDAAVNKLKEQGHSVIGLTCHVSKDDDRKRLVEKTLETFGGIDILVSNAATNPAMGKILECPEAVWDKIFEVNVKNSLQVAQVVIPHMKKRKGGTIVFMSSIAGYAPIPFLGPYSVSKTAVLGLTKVLAEEVASDNIRVNCVCPGVVNTKFSALLVDNEEIKEKILAEIHMKRFADPNEIAGVVTFLCSDDASYMTGESVAVAGGILSRL